VTAGVNCGWRSGRTYRYPAPGPPQSHFTEPPVAKSTPRIGDVHRNGSDRLVHVEHHEGADPVGLVDDRRGVHDEGALEEDVRDRDDESLLVDGVEESLEIDVDAVVARDDVDPRAVALPFLPHVHDAREVHLRVDDLIALLEKSRDEATIDSQTETFWCMQTEPGGAPKIPPSVSPTVRERRHHASLQARTPRDSHRFANSARRAWTPRGIAPRECDTMYVQVSRIGNSLR